MADLFSTINGQQTIATMLAQLQQAGYGGATDPLSVIQAYQNTTNSGVTPMGAQPVTSPVVNGSGGSSNQGNLGGGSSDTQAILDAFKASSGFSLQDLAEKKREFDAGLQQKQLEWQRQGLPQLVIQQRSQALAEDEFAFQKQLAQQNIDLQRGNLGLDYLKTASSMGGPADYFQEDDFLRGAQQRGDVPQFLKALSDNTQLGYSPTGNAPTPLTADNLAARLDGSSGTGGAPGTAGLTPAMLSSLGLTSTGAPAGSALAGAPAMVDPGSPAALAAAGVVGTPGSYGTPGAPVYNAPGPNSPNDTAPGSLMPGTTGMMQGATQNFGYGPGQGSTSISGTRGTNIIGFTPQGLTFDSQFLQPKSKAVFNLWDETTNQNVADNSSVLGAIKGTGSGWSGAYYVPGGNGRYTFGGITPGMLDPTHQYSVRVALPDEGGGVGNEAHVLGSAILALQNPAAPAPSPAAAPAPAAAPPPAAAPAVPTTPAVPTAPASSTNPTGTNTDATLNAFSNVFKAGGSALAPGEIEQLNPDELALMGSAAQKLGFSMPSFLASYGQSRIGQSSGQAA